MMALLVLGCRFSAAAAVNGNDEAMTIDYDVSAFVKVTTSLPFTVNFTMAEQYSCSVTAEEDLMELLDIKVNGDELLLDRINNSDLDSLLRSALVVNLSAPSLDAVKVLGSGDFVFVSAMSGQKLKINILGSGNVVFTRKSDYAEIEVVISGTGNVNVDSGSVVKMTATISGAGSLQSYCDVRELIAKITGSGNILANVNNTLRYDVTGTGKISYYGNPNLRGKKVGRDVLEQLEDY